MGSGFDALFQGMRRDEREELTEALPGKIAKGFFPAAEDQVHLYLVPFFEEFFGLFGAEFEVVASGLKADTEHLYLRNVPFLRPVLAFFARFVVLELAEVHDPDDRRVSGRRDLDNIEPPLFGNVERIFQRNLTDVLAGFVNGAHARGADLIVDAVAAEDSG